MHILEALLVLEELLHLEHLLLVPEEHQIVAALEPVVLQVLEPEVPPSGKSQRFRALLVEAPPLEPEQG